MGGATGKEGHVSLLIGHHSCTGSHMTHPHLFTVCLPVSLTCLIHLSVCVLVQTQLSSGPGPGPAVKSDSDSGMLLLLGDKRQSSSAATLFK